MNPDPSLIILLLIILIIVFFIYYRVGKSDMTYVKSDIDSNMYFVRNLKDKKKAANLLAKIKSNIHQITDYMYKKLENPTLNNTPRYKEFKPYILQLKNKIKDVVIEESPSNSPHTSFTINKGEEMVFCIRSKSILSRIIDSKSNNIHDANLVMYVALHEISHVACPEYNHTPLFEKIFRFICEEAIEMKMYDKIDFKNTPIEYCGMTIDNSII